MGRNKGFSLLEILVAFSIMAVALGIVLTIFSQGVKNAGLSEDYNIAAQLAESLLAQTGVETRLELGRSEGEVLDKYHWAITIDEWGEDEALDSSPELLRVRVLVQWGEEGRQVMLTQIKPHFSNEERL